MSLFLFFIFFSPVFPRAAKLHELKLRRLVLSLLISLVSDDPTKFQATFATFQDASKPQSEDKFELLFWDCARALFTAHSSFVLATTSQDVEAAKKEEDAFQEHIKTLLLTLQQTHTHIKSHINESPSQHNTISQHYRFGVEIITWVTLALQSWVDHQKKTKKGKHSAWVKATLDPFLTAAHTITTELTTPTLQALTLQDASPVFSEEELRNKVDAVVKEVAGSQKQSHSTITALVTARGKILTSLLHHQ